MNKIPRGLNNSFSLAMYACNQMKHYQHLANEAIRTCAYWQTKYNATQHKDTTAEEFDALWADIFKRGAE